jgi:hypothetical protein
MSRRNKAVAALAAAAALSAAPALAKHAEDGTSRGPSTTVDPYVIPVAPGVSTTSLLTVDDKPASDGDAMVGIPDGLGAFESHGRTFSALMNQELPNNRGAVRRHGQQGAYVTNVTIDRRTLEVTELEDQIDPSVAYWDYPTQTYRATPSSGGPNPRNPGDVFAPQLAAFNRFCSGTLSAPGQLYDKRSGGGYGGQLYFANEEGGDEGRLFGVTEDGQAKQLPRLGLFSWENTKPAFRTGARTVVAGNEDTAAGQLRVYSGTKRRQGDAFERAGLTNGTNFVLDAVDAAVTSDAQWRAQYPTGTAGAVQLNVVDWDQSGASQNREAAADGLSLNRIEDGEWDAAHPDDYYFVTTEGGGKQPDPTDPRNASRDGGGLWKLSLEDREHPELGGTLTLLLDGTEAPYLNKPDNITIDSSGHLLIQEDPGGNTHIARILAYDLDSGQIATLARFDPARFATGGPGFITEDEESSGIIEVRKQLGKNTYLFDAQVHTASTTDPVAKVEKGQLLVMEVDSWRDVFGARKGGRD